MAPRASSRLVDFHSHYYNAAWYPSSSPQGPANLLRAWPLLTNIHAQLADMDGQPMPESMTAGQQIAQLQGEKLVCWAPQTKFCRYSCRP